MIHGLSELTREIETPVLLKDVGKSRFSQAPALHFLEKISSVTGKIYIKKRRMRSACFRQ